MPPRPGHGTSARRAKGRPPRAPLKRTSPRSDARTVAWLLEPTQPAIRYRALTEILGRKENDNGVRQARSQILQRGWAAEILAERDSSGGWGDVPTQYRPKYTSTNWRMLILSDLGLTKTDPVIRKACERWMAGFATEGDLLGGDAKGIPHYCVSANLARALIKFGYEDDPRVRATLEWFVETADPKGGWSCWGTPGRNLDSWEALSAFAVYPRSKWSSGMTSVIEKGAEFFLQRELHHQGDRYAPWYRFHYPIHYYYDILVGLDIMTRLGYAGDPRMNFAVDHLRSRRRRDGRWNLDAVHPDVEGGIAEWFAKHPRLRPTPYALEVAGEPSKMITLTAIRVVNAVDPSRRSAGSGA